MDILATIAVSKVIVGAVIRYMSPVDTKKGGTGFVLTKTDRRGPTYDIIRKNRQKLIK